MADKVAFSLKQGIQVDPIADGANPGDMLADAELDAFFLPQPPRSVIERLDLLRPLFPDPRPKRPATTRGTAIIPSCTCSRCDRN